jgi:hypothetical protein
MTEVLSSLERTGIKIDPIVLAEIEKEYRDEMNALEVKLQRMAEEAMGDTPVNLHAESSTRNGGRVSSTSDQNYEVLPASRSNVPK